MLKGWLQSSVLGLLLAIFVTIFALLNTVPTPVDFLLFKIPSISLALVIMISVLAGVICTGIVAVIEQVRLLKKISELEKKIKTYEPVFKE